MKRTVASVISIFTLLTIATPAMAAFNETIHNQPRGSRRDHKRMAIMAYQHRNNISLLRTAYNTWAQKIMSGFPSTLAVTGGGRDRYAPFHRPSARAVDAWRLSDHCTLKSRRCSQSDE